MNCNLFVHNNFHVSFADIQINGPFRRCRHISSSYWSHVRDQSGKREYCTKNKIYLHTHNPGQSEKRKLNLILNITQIVNFRNVNFHEAQLQVNPTATTFLRLHFTLSTVQLLITKEIALSAMLRLKCTFFETFLRQKIKAWFLYENL
jgi:hypothetical protein